jgi:23S rRNA (uracil1939-C5)-methyltransferase
MGRRFRVSAASFFQVNTAQAGELCRKVLQLAALTGTERVVDLYSGVGMLSIVLAQAAGVVTGVELDPGAVEDARTNAEMAGCSNVTFVAGDVEEVLHGVPAADVVVVDPPRKGCSPAVLKRIVELAPARVIYVSCNPATLARDLSLLEQAGYATTEVEPIDMFPQTFHIETIARLVKSA